MGAASSSPAPSLSVTFFFSSWDTNTSSMLLRTVLAALTLLVGWQEGHPACKNWVKCWRGYLSGWGADLHMVQLMPLPLTVSCFSKIQSGFTFLVLAQLGSPGKRAVKRISMRQERMEFWDGRGMSWTICKQSAHRSREITTPTPHHSIFTDQMLLLTPKQQCQSTEETSISS